MFPKTVAKLSVRDATICSAAAAVESQPDAHAKGGLQTGALLYSLLRYRQGGRRGGRERASERMTMPAREGASLPHARYLYHPPDAVANEAR
jgi:hypothetical protein